MLPQKRGPYRIEDWGKTWLRQRGSDARPVAAHMQHEAVPGRHEDSREAPVRLSHPPDRRNRRATCAMRVLMLRLDRRVGPLRGCRWFNALQIRGQGRAPHVLIPRAFGVDRRRVRWIFNAP